MFDIYSERFISDFFSEEVDHIRHHEFIKNYTMVCHREMSKHGFGYDIFNQKVYSLPTVLVIQKLFMPPTPPTSEEVEGAYWFGSVRAVQWCAVCL